ncbi:MAG: hypothetical protein IGNPGNKH_00847 [Sodalis sp. Ffu]|nr:MAG: hypothetical protein IGNPGNKH_00847 [Sodalis sp. Ffu]
MVMRLLFWLCRQNTVGCVCISSTYQLLVEGYKTHLECNTLPGLKWAWRVFGEEIQLGSGWG